MARTKRQQALTKAGFARVGEMLEASKSPITDFEVRTPSDVEQTREVSDSSWQNMSAPTTNSSRPRALKIAYSKSSRKLVVRFRGPSGSESNGPWWVYNDIPVEMWNDLKSSDSTGKYLASSGLDTHDDMGPFNPSEMSSESRVLFNEG